MATSDTTPARLRVPRQDLDNFDLFPLDAGSARAWARSLSMADTDQSVSRLGEAVRDLNRVAMSPQLRFEVMEALCPSLRVAVTNLSRRFLNQPLVLPEKARQMAEQAEGLHSAFSTAYTLVAVHTIGHGEEPGNGSPARLTCEGLQRAILFAGRRMLQTFQLYQNVEPRVWLTLHQLYALGERQELVRLPVRNPQGQRVTLQDTYLQAALLGCCKANQLRQSDLAGIYRALGKWCSIVNLLDADCAREGLFAIDLDGDHPPMYHGAEGAGGPGVRYLDTRELLAHLESLREADRTNGRPGVRLDEDVTLPSNLLDHLIASLGNHSQRNFSRASGADTVLEVGVGLDSAHFHAAGQRSFADLLPPAHGDDSAREAPGVNGKPPTAPEARHTVYRARAMNTSPGGYCLQWSGDAPAHLRSGDILCVREPGQEDWVIAAVRWISALEQAQTLIGVELLSPRGMPYAARAVGRRGSLAEPVRVLLLPEIQLVGKPHTLITPRNGFRERQKVVLLRDGEEFAVQLQRQVGAAAGYSQFDFRYIRELEQHGASAEDRELPPLAFDSLWSKI